MSRAPILAVILSTLGLLCACGPPPLPPAVGGQVSLGGGRVGRTRLFTDIEQIRGATRTESQLYLGTDRGLYAFALTPDGGLTHVAGLPSDDIQAVAAAPTGVIWVATAQGFAQVHSTGEVTVEEAAPRLGRINDMAVDGEGRIWACGLGGLARHDGTGWAVVNREMVCTTLALTPEGQLWVGTTNGLSYVEGDQMHLHAMHGGLPEGYTRSILPVGPGQVLALLQSPNRTLIAFFDGTRWYSYTLDGLNEPLVGLVRRGRRVLLISSLRVMELAPAGSGRPLIALTATPAEVQHWQMEMASATEHHAEIPQESVLRSPTPPIEVGSSASAPPFLVRNAGIELPGIVYRTFEWGDQALLAVVNAGGLHLPPAGPERPFRTLSLVPEENLQIANDAGGGSWLLGRGNRLARFERGNARLVELPAGLVPQALAGGPRGAYLLAQAGETNTVHVFLNTGEGFRPHLERTLEVEALLGVPFIGVDSEGRIWAALRVPREDGAGGRTRGVAVLDPGSEEVIYHHRGANQGAGGLSMPDEVSNIEMDDEGNVWLSSLSGMIRVGNSQAVVFDAARGVRGEIVNDVVVGAGVIWISSGEGLGRYDRERFSYTNPPIVTANRPTALAMDAEGRLWATGRTGVILHENELWTAVGEGLDAFRTELRDVEIDIAEQIWILGNDRIVLLTAAEEPSLPR